jgi:RHS repeat-associated protein
MELLRGLQLMRGKATSMAQVLDSKRFSMRARVSRLASILLCSTVLLPSLFLATPAFTAEVPDVVHFYHQDGLGSVRMVTDMAGEAVGRHDYLPFGEEIPCAVGGRDAFGYCEDGSDLRIRFTGKERDGESDLDYFGARYLSAAQARFMSADSPFADQAPADPDSWHLYVYCRNNPLRYKDPTGRGAQELAEFLVGMPRGAASVISWGTMPGAAPQPSDGWPSLTGQLVGTVAMSAVEIAAGSGETVVTSPAALTGVGAVAPAVGVAIVAHGAIGGAINVGQLGSMGWARYKGGSHGEMKGPVGDGLESNHMPADSTTDIPRDRGPAIQMDPGDHRLTSSHGSQGLAGAQYRSELADLVKQGRWRDAMAKEIRDVRSLFGTKYNEAIKQMLEYAKELKEMGYLEK